MNIGSYPDTVAEVLDDQMIYPPGVHLAMQRFKQSEPWRGSVSERRIKFVALNRELAAIYQVDSPDLEFTRLDGSSSGASRYVPTEHRIIMTGRLSVVTYLHEFGHALGHNERQATAWSVNLFRLWFPSQFGRLLQVGHLLLRPSDAAARLLRDSAP